MAIYPITVQQPNVDYQKHMVMLIIDSSIGEKIYSPNEWYKHYEPIFKVKKIRYKILGEYKVELN